MVDQIGAEATLGDAFAAVFQSMCQHYRCDYVYRSMITQKLFLGKHSPNSTSLLKELRVENRKADLVMLNGTSTVYEIKSARDSMERLQGQIDAYLQVFGNVYVVTEPDQEEAVQRLVPASVGILVLTSTLTLRPCRTATNNVACVSPKAIFSLLRQSEWLEITKAATGGLPIARPVEMYDACLDRFKDVDPEKAHALMVHILKKRQQLSKTDFQDIPNFILAGLLESGLEPKVWPNVIQTFSSLPIGEL